VEPLKNMTLVAVVFQRPGNGDSDTPLELALRCAEVRERFARLVLERCAVMTATFGSVDATTAFAHWARGNRARFDDRIDAKTRPNGQTPTARLSRARNGMKSEISVVQSGAPASVD